jgi:5-methylcytosine-specific restriction endonuclease McrA
MNHEARRRQNDTKNKKAQLKRIYERDRGICQLCFQPVNKEDWSRDHIKDFALCTQEEARDDANVQLAHEICNNLKHQLPKTIPILVEDSDGQDHLAYNLGDVFPGLLDLIRGSD